MRGGINILRTEVRMRRPVSGNHIAALDRSGQKTQRLPHDCTTSEAFVEVVLLEFVEPDLRARHRIGFRATVFRATTDGLTSPTSVLLW